MAFRKSEHKLFLVTISVSLGASERWYAALVCSWYHYMYMYVHTWLLSAHMITICKYCSPNPFCSRNVDIGSPRCLHALFWLICHCIWSVHGLLLYMYLFLHVPIHTWMNTCLCTCMYVEQCLSVHRVCCIHVYTCMYMYNHCCGCSN